MSKVALHPRTQQSDEAEGRSSPRASNEKIQYHSNYSMEDIFNAFAERSGKGAAPDTAVLSLPSLSPEEAPPTRQCAVDVWAAVCRLAEETLLKRHALVIPGFATIGIQTDIESMGGIWKDRQSVFPYFSLAPAFVAQYCYDRLGYQVPSNHQKSGGSVPVLLNGASLSAYSNGIPRHVAMNTVKELVRLVGNFLVTGHPKSGKKVPLALDVGIATIDFTTSSLKIRWSRRFLNKLADAIKLVNERDSLEKTAGNAECDRRPRTASVNLSANAKLKRVPAPPRVGPCLTSTAARPTHDEAISYTGTQNGKVREVPTPIPHPPSPRAQAFSRPSTCGNIRGAVEVSVSLERPTQASSRPSSVQSTRSAASSMSRNTGTRLNSPTAFTSSSPRNREQFIATLNAIDQTEPNRYLRSKVRKAAFRRMRKGSFDDSWNKQILYREEQKTREREEERERVETFKQALAEQLAKEQQDIARLRKEEQQIQELNKALSARRKALALPRQVDETGALFGSQRYGAALRRREDSDLLAQIAERDEKREQEKVSNHIYQHYLAKQDKMWNERQQVDRAMRRLQQQSLRNAYDKQIAEKTAEEGRHKFSTGKTQGNLFYNSAETAADEKREQREIKLRTREYQLENKLLAEEKERMQHTRALEQNSANREHRRAQDDLLREAARRERDETRKRQTNLSETLKRQMEERKRIDESQKGELKSFKPICLLQNESSDDEI